MSFWDELFGNENDDTRTTRAEHVAGSNRRNIDNTLVGDEVNEGDAGLNEDGTPRRDEDAYGSDRPDADRSSGRSRTYYSIGNVNAWRRYTDARRALIEHQNTYGTEVIGRDGKVYYTYSSQQHLNTARNLRATVYDYQNDNKACDGGDQNACDRVGRYGGASSRQYTGGKRYTPRDTNQPKLTSQDQEVVVEPDGSQAPAETPAEAPRPAPPEPIPPPPEAPDTLEERRQRCEAGGGEFHTDAGGSCFHVAKPSHVEEPTETHDPHPEEISKPTSGGGSHEQQGQGSIHEDGRDGGKSQGEHTIHDLPSGGKTPKNFKRPSTNPNRQRLNTILALESLRQPLREEQDGRFLF